MRRPSFFPPYSLTIAQLTRNNNKRREVKPSSAPPTPIPCFTVIFCILFLLIIIFFFFSDYRSHPSVISRKNKKRRGGWKRKKKWSVTDELVSIFPAKNRGDWCHTCNRFHIYNQLLQPLIQIAYNIICFFCFFPLKTDHFFFFCI